MKILLMGRNGQLGQALAARLHDVADVTATARSQLDLEDAGAVRDTIRNLRPDLIVNAAAFTAVDLAEKERDTAYRVNAAAPGILAREARNVGAAIIHYSTDYVFNGRKDRGYGEDDATGPLNVYGRTKLAGEHAIRESGAAFAIMRVSWLYGGRYGNFVSTMSRLLRERAEVSVVDDQFGCPTWTGAVAGATRTMIERLARSGRSPVEFFDAVGGTFHLAGPDSTSWFGFADAIADRMARDGERVARVLPIPTSQYPRPAARPASSILLSERVRDRFGIALASWQDQLDDFFECRRRMASAA